MKEKTINSKDSQARSSKKLKRSKKKKEDSKRESSLLQSEEQKSEIDQEFQDNEEAEEVMTEHTVYSSETETRINELAENQSNANSSVISELSENAGFEEINMSPTTMD